MPRRRSSPPHAGPPEKAAPRRRCLHLTSLPSRPLMCTRTRPAPGTTASLHGTKQFHVPAFRTGNPLGIQPRFETNRTRRESVQEAAGGQLHSHREFFQRRYLGVTDAALDPADLTRLDAAALGDFFLR